MGNVGCVASCTCMTTYKYMYIYMCEAIQLFVSVPTPRPWMSPVLELPKHPSGHACLLQQTVKDGPLDLVETLVYVCCPSWKQYFLQAAVLDQKRRRLGRICCPICLRRRQTCLSLPISPPMVARAPVLLFPIACGFNRSFSSLDRKAALELLVCSGHSAPSSIMFKNMADAAKAARRTSLKSPLASTYPCLLLFLSHVSPLVPGRLGSFADVRSVILFVIIRHLLLAPDVTRVYATRLLSHNFVDFVRVGRNGSLLLTSWSFLKPPGCE